MKNTLFYVPFNVKINRINKLHDKISRDRALSMAMTDFDARKVILCDKNVLKRESSGKR